ncbi:MAG: GTP-binding protein [Lachnospiraceae bacterium]|nr:GTP-binding protein [Lachnospiraceae bacterium]MDD3616940.1 GTP-binding protein [Lachnospiraceae bacterium]
MDEEIRVPIYFITGFLESGKTTFLKFTLSQDYFAMEGKTLLILCEEGEEEYDKALLERTNTVVEVIEDEEAFTAERMEALEALHAPSRVIIEYNGMWRVTRFEEMELPDGWEMMQQITTVDASTFQVYMNNMKSIFMEMVRSTEMVIFNRCKKGDPLATYRRGIKVANQGAEVIFEDENGEIDNIFEDAMPYDMDAPVIDIAPEDYGLWYVDVMDHPDKYNGKIVKFKGRVRKAAKKNAPYFMPGRPAMTCCADDVSFIGYACKSEIAPTLKHGQWVEVTARIGFEKVGPYDEVDMMLYAENVQGCEPLEEELVYFN